MEDKSHCWDRMLDGTLDSIMMQILPDEVIPTSQQQSSLTSDDKDLGPTIALSSSTHCWGVDGIDSGNWLEIEKCQLKNELSEVSSSWVRLDAGVAKLATVSKESLVDIEVLSYQLKEWGSRLVRLETVIKPSPSTPNIKEQEQVLYTKNNTSSLNWDISHKEYGKGGGLSLASFQSPDDSSILSRIDHLKRTNCYDDDESRSSCRAMRQVQLLPAAAQAATDNFQN